MIAFFISPIALSALTAMLLAQAIKVPIEYLRYKRLDWSLFLNAGGMPSSHSAMMAAVTTSIGLHIGWDNPVFILAIAISLIVVYDATNIRRQAGLHAERINQIVNGIVADHNLPKEEIDNLREVLGHSPGEATVGVLLGIVVALVFYFLMSVN